MAIESLIPQVLCMSRRIVACRTRTRSSALRAGDDKVLNAIVTDRGERRLDAGAEGAWAKV